MSSLSTDLQLDLNSISDFIWCYAFDYVSMKYENDIYIIDKGFMMIYSNGMKYDFKENVPFLNTCFCMVAILSTFLCWSHSSLLFTQSVGYGCLKDVYDWGS